MRGISCCLPDLGRGITKCGLFLFRLRDQRAEEGTEAQRDCSQEERIRPRLLLLAERLLSVALTGDMAAIKEIGDRLDGKPAKAVIADSDRSIELTVRWLTAAEVKTLPKPGEDGLD